MKFIMLAACLLGATSPAVAQSSMARHQAQRENRADTRVLDDRMGQTIAAITAAEGHGGVRHRRANELRDKIDRMRADFSRSKRERGFVSAGELASYSRGLDQIDREIGPR